MFDAKDIARQAMLRAAEIKTERTRKTKRRVAAIGSVLCCAIFAAVIITGPLSREQEEDGWINIPQTQVPLSAFMEPDENAEPYDTGQPRAGTMIQIPEYDSIKGSSDSQKAKAELFNPKDNPCWFKFEITLAESGETIYESDLVAPAMYIEDITLNRTLETGEYETELIIRSYELETLKLMNQISVKINLQIE